MLLVCMMSMGINAWGQEWGTVWYADFSSAPSGMTYSVSNGSVDISTGALIYHQGGGPGNRAINTAFTDEKFAVDTDWLMEFDWAASSSNQNASNVIFATNNGSVFTLTWASYGTTATLTDVSGTELTTTIPIDGYNKATMSVISHFTITGKAGDGIYLTLTNGGTTYVDNVKVSSTYGYPSTFNGSLGRAASHMQLDNIYFKTPAEVGFVASPTGRVVGVDGEARILTLDCLTEGATILYSETAPSADETFADWTTFSNSLSTTADPIYAVATDGTYFSEVSTIETGAGTAISLATSIYVSDMVADGNYYHAVVNATNDQSSILFSPTATLTATFNGETVSLPYTVTTDGVLKVTVSAERYSNGEAEFSFKANYAETWASSDYSTLTADNVNEILGENWVLSDDTGRWASWNSSKSYSYYQSGDGSVSNVTVEANIRMRNVVVLNVGYGLGRNVSGQEYISFLNTSESMIAGLKIYSGYGQDVNDNTTNYSYLLNNNGMPNFGLNNAKLLVQAKYYTPVDVTTVPVTITAAGYATFASDKALDLSNLPEGLTAYVAASLSSDAVTINPITTTVAPGTGLIFGGAAGDYEVPVASEGTEVTDNMLVGVVGEAVTLPQDGTCYVLALNAESKAVFQQVTTKAVASVPAGKAYLNTATASPAPARPDDMPGVDGVTLAKTLNIYLPGEGEATAIKTVETAEQQDGAIYNLAGQRVGKDYKGIVIMNGKKYLVK